MSLTIQATRRRDRAVVAVANGVLRLASSDYRTRLWVVVNLGLGYLELEKHKQERQP